MFFSKKKIYQMDMKQANEALQNIFAACNQAPNTIPFDKLILRKQLNTKRYTRLIVITVLTLVLTFVSPYAIVPLCQMLSPEEPSKTVTLLEDYREGDILYLTFSQGNVLYGEAYLETAEGEIIPALSYDAKTNTIAFPYIADEECNIYIPVKDSLPLHFLLSHE